MKMRNIAFTFLVMPAIASGAVRCDCPHSAAKRAKEMIESKTSADIEFILDPSRAPDGYTMEKEGGAIKIIGSRPRSFLYAAGDIEKILASAGNIERQSPFKTRMLNFTGAKYDIASWVAYTGANAIQLGRNAPARLVAACREADVECYAFLYGCDPMKWGAAECEEFLRSHPSARGKDPGRSWEKGVMCPSDKSTWLFFANKIRSVASAASYDGVAVTFWDDYGIYCHCKRCRARGLDNFNSQVAAIVKCYEEALRPLGKKLLVRTWSSGAPHFLNGEWVHAPGYGPEADSATALWGKAFTESRADTIFQTKVYNCDCQPNAPLSKALGEATKAGKTEFAEWQITGQTLGLGWLPAPVVDHTAWTMKKAKELVGENGGVCLYAGGYNNPDYEALDDIINSINIYAWKELSWNPEKDIREIWLEWARPIYGEAAAPHIIEALRAGEFAAAASFSPLGLGAPTESRFASTIGRREDLLRYTNRHYLEEGRKALEPTKENIARIVDEKTKALECVAKMEHEIDEAAKCANAAPWLEELRLRTAWLKTHLLCSKALDSAMWRYRYLRYLSLCAATDLEEFDNLEKDFDLLRENHKRLFEHDPKVKLSFYPSPCGEREISLRSPIPLMRDIHSNAVECVEKIAGPRR